MQSTWLRSTSGRLGRTTGNGSGSLTDNDSELIVMDSGPPKREQVTRGRSFLTSWGHSTPTRIVSSIPETSQEGAPTTTSPLSSLPIAVEGTLEFRKGHLANDTKSWRRSFVVFEMRNGGSITCYAQKSTAKSMTRISDHISQHDDMVPRLHLPSNLNWVVKDIQHNTMNFVIEIPSNEPLLSRPENAATTTTTTTIQNEQDHSSQQSPDQHDHEHPQPHSEEPPVSSGNRKNSGLLLQDLQQDIDRAKSKGQTFRIHFRCSRANEKNLWLRAFEQTDRLSFDLHRQRGLMNIFGNPNLKISHSRSRSHTAHLCAKVGMALETPFFERDDGSAHSIHDDPGIRLRERFQVGSGPDQGTGIKEYLVYPLYAYPNRWMTHSELYSEMIKPSETFHDLRESYAAQKEIGFIKVEVLQCLGLPALDFASETDAVAYLVCGSYAFTTDVIWNKLNPMWLPRTRRACIFPLFHAYARLFVGIFDDDGKGEKDDFAGRVVLDIARCRPRSTYDITLPLRLSNHVYSRRPRGAVRLRFSIEYKSDRDAILSYIPRSLEPPSPARRDDVTVICADEKAFRNVATTVHGIHMPGKFSFNLWKATMREMNFARKVITNSLIELFLNIVTWKNPAMSLLIFSAWMYGVYRNDFSLVPIYLLSFLLLMMIQSYAFYGSDGPIQNGFVPPSWEELFFSLVKGGSRIEPLTTNVKVSRRSQWAKKGHKVMIDARTHRQRGNWLFRLLGFPKSLPMDSFYQEDYHMEFPYSRGIRNRTTKKAWYPKFTVLESLVTKSKTKKNLTDDEGENIGDIGVSSINMTTSKRRRTWDLFTVSQDNKEKGRKLSLPSWGTSTRLNSSNRSTTIEESKSIEEVTLPKRLQYPDQNIDAKGPTRKKKIGDELGELRENVHKMMFHLFNDRTHRIRRSDATYFGSRTAHLDQDLERLLNTGFYSSAIPIVARISVYMGPIIGATQSGLCLTRALYNIFTWRDPILSFWLTMVLTISVAILSIFPWRLFFFVTGFLIVGPQNYLLRIMTERGTTPKFLSDFMEKRKQARAARLAEKQRVKDVPRNQPILSCHTSDNSAPPKVTIHDVDPREVHEVCVPYSQLMYHRMYDWPPEAAYSKCEPTATYDERVAPRQASRTRSGHSSSDLLSLFESTESVTSL